MNVLPMSEHVDSAQLARVSEVTPMRHFKVLNDNEAKPARVVFNVHHDSLYCATCEKRDDCTHTARVRLCGILTGHVNKHAGIERVKR